MGKTWKNGLMEGTEGKWRGWKEAGTERETEGQVGGVEEWMEAEGEGGYVEGWVGRTKGCMERWKNGGDSGWVKDGREDGCAGMEGCESSWKEGRRDSCGSGS